MPKPVGEIMKKGGADATQQQADTPPAEVKGEAQQTGTENTTSADGVAGKAGAEHVPAEGSNDSGAGKTGSVSGEDVTAEPKSTKSPHEPDWRDGRIAKQSEKLREMTAELARLQGQKPQTTRESNADFEARVNAEADKRAQGLAENRRWLDQIKATETAGQTAFGKDEFDRSVAGLQRVVDFNDAAQRQAYVGFMNAAIETGEAAKLVHMLGQDPNEAARIIGLSPVQQAIALTKLAAKEDAGVTKAPKPIAPVASKGAARTEIDPSDKDASDELSIAEFMKRRAAAIESGKSRARR